ncbi:hypothetical protein DRE_05366 [Drechslerella stenobrocha 248]|uniref:Glycosyl transferase CAP10 domain-containing protein n=1 Tax=Drechslerella stenobrocha 248 TaxID=1043628 RepID=W7I022_9PEZI|nr:hypothetical protein DRE_05366 [Drechslerella stenobrocha 248]
MGLYRKRSFFLRVAYLEGLFAAIGVFVVFKYIFGIGDSRFAIGTTGDPVYPMPMRGQTGARKLWGGRSLMLTEKQCRKEYPLLFQPIDESVARGEFDFHRGPDEYAALVTARIKDNRLYIISNSNTTNNNVNVMHRSAALHQIHKSLITALEPLPDTVFAFTPVDYPKNNSWVYAKWYDHTDLLNYWPVPHFGHWSWPTSYVGPLTEALATISEIEATLPFDNKIDQLFWRGTSSFNPLQNRNLRSNLIAAAANKEWADIGELKWTAIEKARNVVQIPEICRYKYIAYTEGISYSGRLPFHMLCESIIITPPINYLLHSTHLMKPVYAWTLGFASSTGMGDFAMKRMQKAWPRGYPPEQANAVFVSPDWSDLEETVMWLRANPKIARGIARRQKEMYVERGYLSESAEMCYWRETIRGWNKSAFPVGDGWNELGMPWETFSLTGKTDWA